MRRLILVPIFRISTQIFAKNSKHFNLENELTIQGFDPVASFTQNKAIRGKKELAVAVDGNTYYLTIAKSKELFKKDYKKYDPQYGGGCDNAMGSYRQ